jgi:hypothetical protein
MLSISDIAEILNDTPDVSGSTNKYLGSYNKLLYSSFEERPFVVTFLGSSTRMEVAIRDHRNPCLKAVLLLLAVDERLSEMESAAAAKTMKQLLTEVEALDIPTIHGICASGTRAAFYRYDRKQAVITPDSEKVYFDMDLTSEDGATHLLKVTEDAKRMCRELGKLK